MIPRLEILTIGRLRGTLPRVAEAKDLVQQAIKKTIGGERNWIPENCTLFHHLASVIKSDISHATNSSEARLIVSDPSLRNDETAWPPDIADETPNQEKLEEWRSERRRLLEYLNRKDPKMGLLIQLKLRDVNAEDLCRLLKLTPPELANLRKRLKRALQAYDTENGS